LYIFVNSGVHDQYIKNIRLWNSKKDSRQKSRVVDKRFVVLLLYIIGPLSQALKLQIKRIQVVGTNPSSP